MLNNLQTKILLFILAIVLFLFLLSAKGFANDKIVAVVNNEIITQKDLDDFKNFMYLQLSAEYKDKELEEKIKEALPEMLNRLIEDKLILQQAKKDSIPLDEVRVKARMAEIKSRYPSEAIFQEILIKQGLTQADIESKIRDQLLIFRMVESEVKNKIIISPREVTDFYESNSEKFIQPEGRKVISLITENEDAAKKALTCIQAGSDFSTVSKDYSLDLNNLGIINKGQLVKEIEGVIFNLNKGGISDLVKLDKSNYIFKVEEILPERTYELSEVQDRIYNYLYESKTKERLIEWLDGLRKKSYVEFK